MKGSDMREEGSGGELGGGEVIGQGRSDIPSTITSFGIREGTTYPKLV